MDSKKVKKINDLKVLKDLFNAVTEQDILVQHGRDLFYRGKKLPEDTRAKLIVDANLLITMDLWNILLDCMRHEANKQLYESSKTIDDMIFGKAMLLTLEIFRKKVYNLSVMK